MTTKQLSYCGRCHQCGDQIAFVLDGAEWCARCQRYQTPVSHGWSISYGDLSSCWPDDHTAKEKGK